MITIVILQFKKQKTASKSFTCPRIDFSPCTDNSDICSFKNPFYPPEDALTPAIANHETQNHEILIHINVGLLKPISVKFRCHLIEGCYSCLLSVKKS